MTIDEMEATVLRNEVESLNELNTKQATRIAELERQLAEAVAAERGACAMVADVIAATYLPAENINNATAARFAGRNIAAAIRARGQS